jgi:hypothetical protein
MLNDDLQEHRPDDACDQQEHHQLNNGQPHLSFHHDFKFLIWKYCTRRQKSGSTKGRNCDDTDSRGKCMYFKKSQARSRHREDVLLQVNSYAEAPILLPL